MHVRFSRCIGMSVCAEHEQGSCGALAGIVIHPDTGGVEGFFVRSSGLLGGGRQFLSVDDIIHWGARITIRSADALCPLEDVIRVHSSLRDGRTVLGQPMICEDGTPLGRCRDVQFTTHLFRAEWLYPRRMFRWRLPVAITDVVEIRPDAIIVRNRGARIPVRETLAPQPA